MIRTIGSPVEYQQLLEKWFQTCVKGLTDTVGWNDSTSFRMLAKLLACVPGLERDSQISISCQFSITDTSVDHGDGESDSDEKPVSEAGDDKGGSSNEKSETNGTETAEIKTSTSADAGDAATKPSEPAEGHDSTSKIEDTSNGKVETKLEAGQEVIQTTTTITIEKAPMAEATADVAVEIAKLTISNAEDDDTEDIIPESDTSTNYCEGPCHEAWSNWKELKRPFYLCLQCSDTKLEENCYKVSPM
jgi:hypothetical protein